MSRFRDFLQLGRAGSWPLTLLPLVWPYLLNQPLLSLYTVWLIVLSFLMHTATIIYNNVADYEWDKEDQSRRIYPLYDGRLDYNTAVLFANYYLFAVSVLMLITCLLAPGNRFYALISLIIACISGHCYNDLGFSKRASQSWLYAAVYTASLIELGYFLGADSYNNIVAFMMLYVFFRLWFQISYSGRLKDITTAETNELKKMGARYDSESGLFYPGYAWLYALFLTLCETGIGLYIFIVFSYNAAVIPVIAALLVIGFMLLYRVTKPRRYVRNKEVIYLTCLEIVFIYLLPVILSSLIGYLEVGLILGFALLWFLFSNKFIWGTPYTKF